MTRYLKKKPMILCFNHLRTIAMPRIHPKYIEIFKETPINSCLDELQKITTP